MAGGKKIVKNTSYLIMSSVVSLGISIVTTSIIARHIGPELYGRYTFGLNFILLFSVLSNFGIESLFIREAARDNKYISNIVDILHLKVVLAMLTVFAVALSANILDYPDPVLKVIYILCIGLFFQILYESLKSLYMSLERIHIIAIFNVTFRLIGAALVITAIYTDIGFIGIVWSFTIATTLIFLAMFAMFNYEFRLLHLKLNPKKWLGLIKQGLPFYISALFTMLYVKINIILMSKLVGESEIGFYMAALTLVESIMFLSASLNTSVFPAFSRMYGDSMESLKITYQKMMKYLIIITTGVAVGTILVSEQIIQLIYGDQFGASGKILQVLIFFWVMSFFTETQSSLLFSIGKETHQVKVMGLACVINVVLSYIMITKYGVLGAAYALIITEFIAVSIITYLIRKQHLKYQPDFYIAKLVFVALGMYLVVKPILELNLILAIIMGAISYTVLLFVLRVFDREDIEDMRNFIKRKT